LFFKRLIANVASGRLNATHAMGVLACGVVKDQKAGACAAFR